MLLAVAIFLFQFGLITYGDDLCPVSKITSAGLITYGDDLCPVSKITSAGRENILKKLNDIRTKVAMGQFSTSDGTYPAAKEMYKLVITNVY
ncbi:unnamed protein product [Dracunculus medinensis]|uniref:SCP domain-containing protein n=1 Tax=Dracunculus medinensis TaxID=318479 RepID=A0A0N4UQ02_DRAME|nr:unnamed protein product [Dracunculus medinensis]